MVSTNLFVPLVSKEDQHEAWVIDMTFSSSTNTRPPWRTEPEIDPDRQNFLTACLATQPDIKQNIYPFKGVKLYHCQKQRDVHSGVVSGQLFKQGELHVIAGDIFDPAEPYFFAITQLIELAGLGAQHAAQVMRRFAFHDGSLPRKLLHEESSSHGEILS